jgi:hypothetical protein
MPASHLGKPRLAGLHDFVQVLEGAVLDLNWLSFAPMHNPFDTKHSCLSSNTHVSHRHCLPVRLACGSCSLQFGLTSILSLRLPHLAQTTRERKYGISVSAG